MVLKRWNEAARSGDEVAEADEAEKPLFEREKP
jgi:hypothetical protein